MIAGIAADVSVNVTLEDFADWVAGGRGPGRALRLHNGQAPARECVLRSGLPICGPQSISSQIWLIDPSAGPGAILIGRLRLLCARWSFTGSFRFEGGVSVDGLGRGQSRASAGDAGRQLAVRMLASIADEVHDRAGLGRTDRHLEESIQGRPFETRWGSAAPGAGQLLLRGAG